MKFGLKSKGHIHSSCQAFKKTKIKCPACEADKRLIRLDKKLFGEK